MLLYSTIFAAHGLISLIGGNIKTTFKSLDKNSYYLRPRWKRILFHLASDILSRFLAQVMSKWPQAMSNFKIRDPKVLVFLQV